jgi:hypothetical protein
MQRTKALISILTISSLFVGCGNANKNTDKEISDASAETAVDTADMSDSIEDEPEAIGIDDYIEESDYADENEMDAALASISIIDEEPETDFGGETGDYKDLMRRAINETLDEYWKHNQSDDWKNKEEYFENSRFCPVFIDSDDKPEIQVYPAFGMIEGRTILFFI